MLFEARLSFFVCVYFFMLCFSVLGISFPTFAVESCSLSFKALFYCYQVSEAFLALLSQCH